MQFEPHVFYRSLTACLLCFWLASAPHARAQLSQFISPGELSNPHQVLDGVSNCTQCHAASQGVPDKKCLDCHNEIQIRLNKNEGYHARQSQSCISCHSEHKGKNYDLMGLSRLRFDHDETSWILGGKHLQAECRDCHKNTRTHAIKGTKTSSPSYLGTSSRCDSCHKDIHNSRKSLFKLCQNCHTTSGFRPAKKNMRFNHNRQTAYPLTGSHRSTRCYGCHSKKIWAPMKFAQCGSCHSDPHRGKFGSKCEDCHNTSSWKDQGRIGSSNNAKFGSFDHQKTRFPLKGKHRYVDCNKCHGKKLGKIEKFSSCNDCHNNPHGSQFVKNWKRKVCKDCHTHNGWELLVFQHNQDARYKLQDQHLQIPCQKCHLKGRYRWLKTAPDCDSCHRDVHRGQFRRQKCTDCHSVKGFRILKFDHNRQSRFPLEGKHAMASCSSCHKGGKYRGISTYCGSCHADVHGGELGKNCKKCHNAVSFKQLTFNHNRDSRFPLTGKHRYVKCQSCHAQGKYKTGQLNCIDCHPDVHKGKYGNTCEKCHNTQSFKDASRDHHDFETFSLKGIHNVIDCDRCHNQASTLKLKIKRLACSSCHQDPHMNSFGNQCQDCHNQYQFLPSTFRHRSTGFELSGAHRFVSCDACHKNRVFGGLPSECQFCHIQQFAAASQIPQHQAGITDCQSCHRTFGWRPAR